MTEYNKIAKDYHSQTFKSLDENQLELDLVVRAGILNDNYKVMLDIGCGSGIQHQFILKRNPNIEKIIAVDTSKELIKIAISQNNNSKVRYMVADMHDMPLDDEEFDFVYSRFAIHYSNNLEKVFKEINRVTKPGGILYFQDANPIFALFRKESHDYAEKENVAFSIKGGNVTVIHPSFTFEEYIQSALKTGWKIISFEEYFGTRCIIDNFRIPTEFSMKLKKES